MELLVEWLMLAIMHQVGMEFTHTDEFCILGWELWIKAPRCGPNLGIPPMSTSHQQLELGTPFKWVSKTFTPDLKTHTFDFLKMYVSHKPAKVSCQTDEIPI